MKRQSAAEAALAKQIKRLGHEIAQYYQAHKELRTRIDTLEAIKSQIEDEIASLKSTRMTASEARKP